MPEAANHGTDMITKIVPMRPPIWREIRHSHSITLGASFGSYTDDPSTEILRYASEQQKGRSPKRPLSWCYDGERLS